MNSSILHTKKDETIILAAIVTEENLAAIVTERIIKRTKWVIIIHKMIVQAHVKKGISSTSLLI